MDLRIAAPLASRRSIDLNGKARHVTLFDFGVVQS